MHHTRFKWLSASCFLFFITGCSHVPPQPPPPKQYGEFCSQARECKFLTKLHKKKVVVSFYGDAIYLNVASDQLFEGRQTVLTVKSADTMEAIADFLSCYQKITIKVTGYSGAFMTDAENQAYGKQQADAVVQYLWKACVHARMIYATSHSLPAGTKDYLVIETNKLP